MYGYNFGMPFMYSRVPYAVGVNTPFRGIGGLFSSLKGVNWSNTINGISKTLGVVKEAIPIVKEVRPMMNNMKSLIKVASAFNDVTDKKENTNVSSNQNNNSNSNNQINSNKPNFFL